MSETHELQLKFTGESVELVGHAKKSDKAVEGVGQSAKKSSDSLDKYEKSSDQASKSNKKLDKSSKGLISRFKVLGPAIVAVTAAFGSIAETTSVEKKYQKIDASLVTVTGSYQKASMAMMRIEDLTKNTPFQLEEVSNSFIKLANMGLKPSERAIISYGNTAAAMGKQLDQMIEAVADAAVGEFERLKEFGIKSRVEGDKVKFTFKGVTTEVGNNSKEIQAYLLALGETDFAGGMDRQMETIGGALSNFSDQWDSTIHSLASEGGLGDLIEDSVRQGTAALKYLQDNIGPATDEITAMGNLWGNTFGTQFSRASDALSQFVAQFDSETQFLTDSSLTATQFLSKAFVELPANLIAAIQLMTIEVANFIADTTEWATESWNTLQGMWAAITGNEAEVERLIDERLNMMDRHKVAAEARKQARLDSIDAILLENQAAITAYDAEREKLKQLREERTRQLSQGGSLADLVGSENSDGASGEDGDALTSKEEAKLLRLEESFMAEKELLLAQYQERQAMLDDFLEYKKISEDKHNELSKSNHAKYTQAIQKLDEQASQNKRSMLSGMFGIVGNLMNAENKKAFERQKKASIAQQLVELPHSIQQSYENGGGYPWGLIPAGIMLIKGMQLIKKTKSQSFSGGGSVSISGGGGGSSMPAANASMFKPQGNVTPFNPPQQQQAQQLQQHNESNYQSGQTTIQVIMDGANFQGNDSRKQAEEVMEHLEGMSISPTSRLTTSIKNEVING